MRLKCHLQISEDNQSSKDMVALRDMKYYSELTA